MNNTTLVYRRLFATSVLCLATALTGCAPESDDDAVSPTPAQPSINREEEINRAANLVGATAAEVTTAGNWIAVDAANPRFFYELPSSVDSSDDAVVVRTKRISSDPLNDARDNTSVTSVIIDCKQQLLTFGGLWVEYLDTGEFGSYMKSDEGETLEQSTAVDLSSEHKVIFDSICASSPAP